MRRAARAWLLLAVLPAACADDPGAGGSDGETVEHFEPGGPNQPGVEPPASDGGPDPFTDAGAPATDAGDGGACDDATGNGAACDAPSGCLTAALCATAAASLSPRAAGLATACMAGLDDCAPGVLGDCLIAGAELGCHPAATGTIPCDVVAAACAGGDPFGAVDQCLAAASSFTSAAATSLQGCLTTLDVCDPAALGTCAVTLLPGR